MYTILMKFRVACLLILAFSTLSGCETLKSLGDSSTSEEDYTGWSAEKFRTNAKEAVDASNYDKAIKLYEALEARYPFDNAAPQTQLDSAYAYYKNNDAEAALAAADRFIKTYPRELHVDYAYYLKGLVNYNRGISFIDRFLPTDTSQRDQAYANDALENFAELTRRFPHSQYLADAQQRTIAIKNNLAMHEIHIARYYMKRGAYIAAANRANTVIDKYDRTIAVPEALDILQEAYTQLNLPQLARDAKRVYDQNYPTGAPAMDSSHVTISHEIWDFIGLDK
ncbi:MAG TPA: outer membrane protein assembly factor BamD [Methylococcaceae bacterium]|nr:outer membrane protein assembly factor BamD [Methylococcaceae bacterium]